MLLYVGRLKRYKRVEWLLDAVAALPDATLHIVGQGDWRPCIERAIAARALRERVVLHGFVDEQRKRELMQAAWLNVTASSIEGWCLTVIEAAACGTRSFANGVGGLPEAILHGRTGVLAHDRGELTVQIARVLRDMELRDRLGVAALRRARTFSWRATAEGTLDVLRAELEESGVLVVPATGRFRSARRGAREWASGNGRAAAAAKVPGDAVLTGRATDPAMAEPTEGTQRPAPTPRNRGW